MSIVPTVIISNTAFGEANGDYNGTNENWFSTKYHGRGYYGYSDGLHTFSYKVTGFVGIIKVEASLATNPTEDDWFDVGSPVGDGVMPFSSNSFDNVTGNFVWVRIAVANFTAGAITRVLYN